MSEVWAPRPLRAEVDLEHGGRWTSLRTSGVGAREWLWSNPGLADERAAAAPGQPFVDAGGGEECFPSVTGDAARGRDHGDVWHRRWWGSPDDAHVVSGSTPALRLRRRLAHTGNVRADYEIHGAPGARILHAVHLLLALSDDARLQLDGSPSVTVLDRPRPGSQVATSWPDGDDVRLDVLGPSDGTARCAVVTTDAVEVIDGDDRLSLRWGLTHPGVGRPAESPPLALIVWRNLGGWPIAAPYRSIGIEPVLGRATDLDAAGPDDVARVPSDGRLAWWVEIGAASRASQT